jgi:hypothetical protein
MNLSDKTNQELREMLKKVSDDIDTKIGMSRKEEVELMDQEHEIKKEIHERGII